MNELKFMPNNIFLYKNRYINPDKKVEVYRCLNRKGKVYSIRQRGVVVAHTDNIVLEDCEFVVNASGKKKALETMERNVHAFIRGKISDREVVAVERVTYHPFDNTGFVSNGQTIEKAKGVIINHNGVKTTE